MPRLRLLHPAWMILGSLLVGACAHAVEVYRCPDNLYQQSPCPGGSRIDIDPETNLQKMPDLQDLPLELPQAGAPVYIIPMPRQMEVSPSPASQPMKPSIYWRRPFDHPHGYRHRHDRRPQSSRHAPPPQVRPRYPATRVMR